MVKRQMTKAWAMQEADDAVRSLKSLATQLDTHHPDAAASLREGLEETVMVMRLGVSGLLPKSLSTTDSIESAFDTVRTRTRNVKHWRNGNMIQRWTAAGLLTAEQQFRKIKGCREMTALRTAIRRLTVDKANEGENQRKIA